MVGAEMLLSARRAVRAPGVPLKLAAGRKRREVAAVRKRPAESVKEVAISVHVEALSHCQMPCAEVAALAVRTTPRREFAEEPPETVSVESEKFVEKREEMEAPVGAVLSSLTGARVVEPVTRGASLTAVMDVEIVAVLSEVADVLPLLVVSMLTRV